MYCKLEEDRPRSLFFQVVLFGVSVGEEEADDWMIRQVAMLIYHTPLGVTAIH